MGDICQLSCECGYSIDLYVGVGFASSKLNTLRRVFSEEERKDFEKYYNNNEVESFYITFKPSFCEKCKEIMTVAVLKVRLTNNRELEIVKNCSACNSKVQILHDSYKCPKCNKELHEELIGVWD